MAEILAPAGNGVSFDAALNSGADAIYLGLTDFSARKSAANFTLDNLKEYAAYAHVLGCKVYVALNTLVKDAELADFFRCALQAWNSGADALIIQDIFLGKLLHEVYPEIVLHLSTQAGICNVYGAKLAKRYGFSRVILARETPLSDIQEIAKILETEVFVQGALCTCFSGQCYMSSFAGGNSGNRGYCKQPCRKKYKINRIGFEKLSYRLSLSDLCMGKDVFKLIQAGVCSFKIEGRMRSAAYVGSAVKYYRDILDQKTEKEKEDYSDLCRAFNRGGFTRGYAFGQDPNLISSDIQGHAGEKIGKISAIQNNAKFTYVRSDYKPEDGDGFKVIRCGKEEIGGGIWRSFYPQVRDGFCLIKNTAFQEGDWVCLTSDVCLEKRVSARRKKIKLSVVGLFCVGKTPEIRIRGAFGEKIFDADFLAQEAQSRPFTEKDFSECFMKTDEYPFEVVASAQIKGNIFIVKSQLNALRRTVFRQVYAYLSTTHAALEERKISTPVVNKELVRERLLAVIDNDFTSHIYKKIKPDYIIFKPNDYNDEKEFSRFLKLAEYYAWHKLLYLPAFSVGMDLKRILKVIKEFDGVYADGVFALEFCREFSIPLFAGNGFNLFNSWSALACKSEGVIEIALSKELSDKEAEFAKEADAFCLSGGGIKLMDLGHCVFGKRCSTCDGRDLYEMTDEEGRIFPLRRYKNSCCRFEVYNYTLLAHKRAERALYDFTALSNSEKEMFFSDAVKSGMSGFTSGAAKRGIK